jgi:Outer membrane protein SusF_SusE
MVKASAEEDERLANTPNLISFYRKPKYPLVMFLVGGSTPATWDSGKAIPFVKTGDGTFEIFVKLTVDGFGFKFLPQVGSFNGDWGAKAGAAGTLEQNGEDNVSVSSDGFYRITLNFVNKTYNVTKVEWGVIGSGTTGTGAGWGQDIDMTFDGGYKWSKTLQLFATSGNNEIKFRANDAWDINFGDNGANGSLEYGGNNIAVPANGSYKVEIDLNPITGYKYTLTPQ